MAAIIMAVSITLTQATPIACSPRGADGEATLLSPQLFRVMKINKMIASVSSTLPQFSCVLRQNLMPVGHAKAHGGTE